MEWENRLFIIDPQKAHDLDRDFILQELYYRPEGYYRTAKKMLDACKKAGYKFTLSMIKKWLNRQALYQIHKPQPKFIQYASFNDMGGPTAKGGAQPKFFFEIL